MPLQKNAIPIAYIEYPTFPEDVRSISRKAIVLSESSSEVILIEHDHRGIVEEPCNLSLTSFPLS